MKKFYADPMMDVKSFETENIVTTVSGEVTNQTIDELKDNGVAIRTVKLADLNIVF
jgi:hypothetical protein